MNRELKNNVLVALLTATLASGGFLARDHFESENEKSRFIFELHKKLYDESASALKKVNKSYSDLYRLYGESFGLTPSELSDKHNDFSEALEKYSNYIDELERYGTTGQVQIAKKHREWLWAIYFEFDLQLKMAKQVEGRVKELLLIEDVESEYFNFVKEALQSDIEKLVRNENRIFYLVGQYEKPVADGFEQYLNYQFREALGISATSDMADTVNSLPKLIKESNSFSFEEKKLPFMFAEGRSFQAPTLEFEGDTSFFEEKNKILSDNVRMKFIASTVKNDEYLREELKKRKLKFEKVEDELINRSEEHS